ncbi:MAG: serine/threonine-protein kinase [Planctomycetota bacterium]|jgi:serine/threonine-protein kinase
MLTEFGKFRLLLQIGGGRLSEVFRVSRLSPTHPEPKIALKRVAPALITESAFVELVVREAGLLAHLAHPNLCQCQEMGVVDGCAFLTLDLVDGCTLRALMRRLSALKVKLPPSATLALGHQLALVLDYLHRECEAPLVHLDLSPQNVMISQEGEVKLIDFGIARYLDGQDPPPLGGKIAGTVGYMSPEQARGRKLDARADQFGLGILLWEMLSGKRLFRGNTKETWQRMRGGDIPSAKKYLKEAPEPLVKVLLRLLRADPGERFASTREVADQLLRVTSDVQSGKKPLSALVQRLMKDDDFDPFDVVKRPPPPPLDESIPRGEIDSGEGYEEISIQVDSGEGTPASLIRAVLPEAYEPPDSPFLEEIPDAQTTAESGG